MSWPPLLRQDRANHSHIGAELAAVAGLACLLCGWGALVAAGAGLGLAVLAGAVKEWRDSRRREFHAAEWGDFWYTVRGGAHVAAPLALVGWLA